MLARIDLRGFALPGARELAGLLPRAGTDIDSVMVRVRPLCEDVPILYIQYWDWFVFFSQRVKGLPEEEVLAGTQMYNLANTIWIDEG